MSTSLYDADEQSVPLGAARRGFAGIITQVGGLDDAASIETERRLIEIGFVEGARISLLHEGFWGRDPIAVKLDDMRVALRRREANLIFVREDKKVFGL